MKKFEEDKFSITKLKGISEKTITEHLKLYAGYVKNANLILESLEELGKDSSKYAYEISELYRRFAFEFDGMRNHECYFGLLEGDAVPIATKGALTVAIENEWGSLDAFVGRFKSIALTRGIGWVFLTYDKKTDRPLINWVDEQHLGHLINTVPVIALDMWEHSYVMDYAPSGKKQYVEDFFENLNWNVAEKNLADTKAR